jgi:hypothetical protein
MGRELEFKGEQARFFGLDPAGGPAEFRDFTLSNGNTASLRLKYQGNSMWRLQLRQEVPEVGVGLRPKARGVLGRSPYVAVFRRLEGNNLFALSFPRKTSSEYLSIRNLSESAGTIGHTSSREYGWY